MVRRREEQLTIVISIIPTRLIVQAQVKFPISECISISQFRPPAHIASILPTMVPMVSRSAALILRRARQIRQRGERKAENSRKLAGVVWWVAFAGMRLGKQGMLANSSNKIRKRFVGRRFQLLFRVEAQIDRKRLVVARIRKLKYAEASQKVSRRIKGD